MKEQKRKYWCGPASIQSALRNLGRNHLTQRYIARLCGTTSKEGTGDPEMQKGLISLGVLYEFFSSDSEKRARSWVRHFVQGGCPLIICSDGLLHWVCVYGHLGDVYHVFDPSRYKKLKREHHHRPMDLDSLIHKWGGKYPKWGPEEGYRRFGGYAILDAGK